MLAQPFYDPGLSYQENFDRGPFGIFADAEVYLQTARPRYTFLGHKVFAPFGIPAGPLLNSRYVIAALDKGFDIPVYKTVRTRKFASHAWPNVLAVDVEGDLMPGAGTLVAHEEYAEPLSITNSFGVPSFDPEFWQADIAAAVRHAKEGQVVVASFQGTKAEDGSVAGYIEDFRTGARLLKETGVKVVEVNLSCPNEGTSALLCFDAARSRTIVEAIKEELGEIPLVIKIAYFGEDAALAKFLGELGHVVDGISAINTIPADIVDREGRQALPGEGRLRSGVCGRSIRWAGLEMSRRLAEHRERMGLAYTIVGVGGVGSAQDYEAYRKAGADAVMSSTAAMWNPRLAMEIKESVDEL